MIAGIVLSILAYLEPIDGYLSGMVKGEAFSLKKALVCIGHAAIFFVLCASVYVIGKAKGQMAGAVQCVSFITYLVLYFYSLNILKNCKKIFKEDTAPWHVVNTLYFILRFKFIEQIPYLKDYLDTQKNDPSISIDNN